MRPAVYRSEQSIYIGAHRGASSCRPENTMPAFRKAVELGADFLELDVQLTKDGEVIVFHNHHLDEKMGASGMVWDYKLSELRKLDAGGWFSAEFAGERIPTLEEVLNYAKDKIWISIELKQWEEPKGPLAQIVVQLVEAYKMEDQVQIMSFNHRLLVDVRSCSRTIMTNAICACRIADPVAYLNSIGAQVLNVHWHYLSEQLVKTVHDAGLYVHGSVSDDIDIFRLFRNWKVDVMDTNVTDLMVKEREAAASAS